MEASESPQLARLKRLFGELHSFDIYYDNHKEYVRFIDAVLDMLLDASFLRSPAERNFVDYGSPDGVFDDAQTRIRIRNTLRVMPAHERSRLKAWLDAERQKWQDYDSCSDENFDATDNACGSHGFLADDIESNFDGPEDRESYLDSMYD